MKNTQFNDFKQYIKMFYGPNGIYKKFFPPNGAMDDEIDDAILEYHKAIVASEGKWDRSCDSIDRENVKWIIMDNRRKKLEAEILELERQLKYYPEALPDRSINTLTLRSVTI